MKVFVIAVNSLRRALRERTAAFVTFVLPLLLILLLGLLYGNPDYRVGIVADDGILTQELTDGIRTVDGIVVEDLATREDLLDAIAHSDLDVGLVVPPTYDSALRAGGTATIEYVATDDLAQFSVSELIEAEINAHTARVAAAQFAEQAVGASFDDSMRAANEATASLQPITVNVVASDDGELEEIGIFDLQSSRMLVLFVFLTAMSSGAAHLIQTRDLGMSQRMLGTPTSAKTIIGGEGAGRFLIAFLQSLVIVLVAAFVFGVAWGNWPATLAIVGLFAATAAGAGMLLGSLGRTEQMATGIGVFVALGFAMLGGSMGGPASVPVPHAWANEAFDRVMLEGAGLADIGGELGVLALYAVGFLAIAAVVFRRSVVGSGG